MILSIRFWMTGVTVGLALILVAIASFEHSKVKYKEASLTFWGDQANLEGDAFDITMEFGGYFRNYIEQGILASGGPSVSSAVVVNSCDPGDVLGTMIPIRSVDSEFVRFDVLCGWGSNTYVRNAVMDDDMTSIVRTMFLRSGMTEYKIGDAIPNHSDYVLVVRNTGVKVEQGYADEFDWFGDTGNTNLIAAYKIINER